MADKRHTEHGQLWLHFPPLLLSAQHLLLSPLIRWGKGTSGWSAWLGHPERQTVQTLWNHSGKSPHSRMLTLGWKWRKRYTGKSVATNRLSKCQQSTYISYNFCNKKLENLQLSITYCWVNVIKNFITSCITIYRPLFPRFYKWLVSLPLKIAFCISTAC